MLSFYVHDQIPVYFQHHEGNIVYIGISVKNGSKYETPETAGIAHFTEHMMFKGTKIRDAYQINDDFAMCGASNNAYTDNPHVVYYCSVIKENFKEALSILSDMFFNSVFDEAEIQKERGVILNEYKMDKDSVYGYFYNAIGNHFFEWNIGHEILGTPETISKITASDIISFNERTINSSNLSINICGNIDKEEVKSIVAGIIPSEHKYLRKGDAVNVESKIRFKSDSDLVVTHKTIESAYHNINTVVIPPDDPGYPSLMIAMDVLGGGAHSMLFRVIREELGMAYSVGCCYYLMDRPQGALNMISGSTSIYDIDAFREKCNEVILNMLRDGISDKQFNASRNSLLFNYYDTKNDPSKIGKHMADNSLFGMPVSIDERISSIKNVSLKDCNRVFHENFENMKSYNSVMIKES
jgi:predicted Zn-dependent peptidase